MVDGCPQVREEEHEAKEFHGLWSFLKKKGVNETLKGEIVFGIHKF